MYVFPAIDVLDGKAVRLAQGDYSRVTVYNDDVVEQAREWVDQGASWLHIVDLNGARSGVPENIDAIARIAKATDVNIQVGGGVRSLETAQRLLDAGVTRVVLGTKLATDFDFVEAVVSRFGADALVAGVDARDGMVAINGWEQSTTIDAATLVASLRDFGLRHLVYTDISRDGMQTGINSDAYRRIAETAGFPVIVSGGVSTLDDFKASAKLGSDIVEGVITGRALYEDAFALSDAIAVLAGAPLC